MHYNVQNTIFNQCHATPILSNYFRNIQRSRFYDKFYEQKILYIYIPIRSTCTAQTSIFDTKWRV